jgi:hypothetical protein
MVASSLVDRRAEVTARIAGRIIWVEERGGRDTE